MARFCAEKWRPVGDFSRYILQNRRRFSAQNVAVFRIAAATRQRPTHTRLPKPPAPSHDSPLPSPSPKPKIVRPAVAHAKSVAARLHHRISNTSTCFTKKLRVATTSESAPGVALYASEHADMSIIELALSTMCGWCVFSVVSFCIVCSTMRDIRGCQF